MFPKVTKSQQPHVIKKIIQWSSANIFLGIQSSLINCFLFDKWYKQLEKGPHQKPPTRPSLEGTGSAPKAQFLYIVAVQVKELYNIPLQGQFGPTLNLVSNINASYPKNE